MMEQSGLAQVINPDSPFWVRTVFRNFTFSGYGLRHCSTAWRRRLR